MRTLYEFQRGQKRKAMDSRSTQDLESSNNRINDNQDPGSEEQYPNLSEKTYFKARLLAYITVKSRPNHIVFLGKKTEVVAAKIFAQALGAPSVDVIEVNSNRLVALVRR